jgi:hypothetical protein
VTQERRLFQERIVLEQAADAAKETEDHQAGRHHHHQFPQLEHEGGDREQARGEGEESQAQREFQRPEGASLLDPVGRRRRG